MRKAEVYLEYAPLIAGPPVDPQALYQNACASDGPTIEHFRHQWLGNAAANKQRFGSFADHSIASEFNKYRYGPAIVAGSGPSLKVNAHELKNRGQIPLVSCLHNFHYLEDAGAAPEYYVTLDAGPITIGEVTIGGTKTPEEYWEMTKDRTLVAYIGTHPDLLKLWKGKILFFNAPVPEQNFMDEMDKIEHFSVYMSSGGNVLGACLYFARAILGTYHSIFVGADFSFGYDKAFYSWKDPHYDASMGQTIRVRDIYGNSVHTWPSYWGFKQYFDSVALRIPGVYYNCTEGGALGAYDQGNILGFKYMDLKDCLKNFNMNDEIKETLDNPALSSKKILYS